MQNALVRTVLVAVALCAAAWLVLGYRAVQLEQNAQETVTAIQHGKVTPARARQALDDLDSARFLNADPAPDLIEGNLRLFYSGHAQASAIARKVTAKEPENVSGWFLAYLSETGPARREAVRRIRHLDPWAGENLR
ncbi:MAG: hypothetical protein QOE60_1392 [Thermoleophilaceae bacterium]|nr:hypothetical protein [Thermoleophilaceae bacterium]